MTEPTTSDTDLNTVRKVVRGRVLEMFATVAAAKAGV
jgi:hypothetical protein